MAWTAEPRRAADGRGLRYPSDRTDAEWALVAPVIRLAKRGVRLLLSLGMGRDHQALRQPPQMGRTRRSEW